MIKIEGYNSQLVSDNANIQAYFETALEAYRQLPWYKRLLAHSFFATTYENGRYYVCFNR